ncbi:asparaginase [Nocardia carnea]|uniref:asparaginase n=1 Tax=Nocardia carnea TaxID=37328 RepID=UPI00245668B2|nr:asparaginase [Nocardia carnea]
MRTVVVITTGGTIASTADERGVKAATTSGAALLAVSPSHAGVETRVVEAMTVNSYAMTFADMDRVNAEVGAALADPTTCGIVVTHGTDTMEETAMLVDCFHADPRPVVFTGAQRSFDDPAGDGPRNLGDAVAVAASMDARGLGVLVAFDGIVHAARGTRKVHNSATAAFSDLDHGPVGTVVDGTVRVHTKLRRARTALSTPVSLSGLRVDIVAIYPGADRTAIDAHVRAGAHGIVLQATGYGNANADVADAVADHVRAGIPVLLSSRVSAGPIRPVYGGGGGAADLVAAGAVPTGLLRPSQARVLLAALLAAGADSTAIARAFAAEPERYTDVRTEAAASLGGS